VYAVQKTPFPGFLGAHHRGEFRFPQCVAALPQMTPYYCAMMSLLARRGACWPSSFDIGADPAGVGIDVGFHSRASFCASAICVGVMCVATISRACKPAKRVRCAIYARVSTEYGLDQEFNSLDAQHEAAEAYIRSQAHDIDGIAARDACSSATSI
jgi:hypothetical protein